MDYNSLLNRDYKNVSKQPSAFARRRSSIHTAILFGVGFVTMAGLFSSIQDAGASRSSRTDGLNDLLTLALAMPQHTPVYRASLVGDESARERWQVAVVERGDTLSALFSRLNISQKQMYEVLDACKSLHSLTDLRPGEQLEVQVGADGQLQRLRYQPDANHTIALERNESGLHAQSVERDIEVRTRHISGTIQNSLFLDGKQAGLTDGLIMQLAEIFGWDIDFALDIRTGDSFTVVFEEEFIDGERLRTGGIVAAEFTNQGHTYRAVRYTDADGLSNFFTPEGDSMRKAFIRSPVDFRRISSTFQRERFHPVLGKKRPHRGVDYAAATGTPIKAAGDGKVIFRGTKGGYGNTLIIQHGGQITTLYGHISKFAKGVQNGGHVQQGQVVAYVGQSGLATGPHLHYEFRVNGVHRNPLTIDLPDAQPIAAELKADFIAQTTPLVTQLETLSRIKLAAN